MLKALLAVSWHAWDAHDAWRHDPRPSRQVGAFLGLAWSVTMAAAALLERPALVRLPRR